MQPTATMIVLPLLLWSAMTASLARAQDGHQHHAPTPAAAAVVPGQRWDTDAPLRTGMRKIRTAVDALQHYEHGHMGPEQAVVLATQVQEQVAYLVANCKLKPQADAALHVIIAELSVGAQALRSSPADTSVIAPMRQAVQRYPQQFNDPGWSPADEPEEAR